MERERRPHHTGRGFLVLKLGSLVRFLLQKPVQPPFAPRKEVIQAHLPVHLPCYDFVPVTSPTLGVCLPCGLAQRLQVLPASMT